MKSSATFSLLLLSFLLPVVLYPQDVARNSEQNARAGAAFEAFVPVLRNPRCLNCHSRGDSPREGDDRHLHNMNVRRGPHGDGANAVKCSTCHQNHNLAGVHTPPGALDWGLPPPDTPMIWEGLTDHQLCQLLKDPRQNGHRSVQQIVGHMSTPLVLWGWHPGEGRTPVPMPESEFLAEVKEWALQGASCPAEATTAKFLPELKTRSKKGP
jgi:hypothetical protein